MQKETRRNSAAGSPKPNPPRKLTRAEKKQIAEIIRQAKGDGKAHTAQQTIPYKLTHIVDVEKLEIIIKNSEKQTF